MYQKTHLVHKMQKNKELFDILNPTDKSGQKLLLFVGQ